MKKTLPAAAISLVVIGLFSFSHSDDNYFEVSRNIDIFCTLFKELNASYVDDIDPDKLMVDGINAMLSSLDPYTDYIPESEQESYKTSTTGEYGGIGATVGKRDGICTVLMLYRGFPAFESGLKIGDQITHIDGEALEARSSSEVSRLLKGKPSTSLTLTVKRYNEPEPFEVDIERANIVIDNVTYCGMYNEDIGFIRLSEFTTNAGKELSSAFQKLKNEGAKKIILDLRANPGGLLREAVKVANIFLPKGSEIVSTRGRSRSVGQVHKAAQHAIDTEIPMVVLISGSTASAAEIVSGSIQDYDRGILIGKKTFGKGLVQSTRQLPYDSQLKLTTAKYYIPSGRCIQAIDYSHRNKDGSVGKIPDSLKVAFKTKNGRTVYDGGGIDPDIEVDMAYYSNLLLSMMKQNVLFDYATTYYYDHPAIDSARRFTLSEADYADFVNWTERKKIDFSSEMDKAIASLEQISRDEKYYEGLKTQIDELKGQLRNLRSAYLEDYKAEVKTMLEEEIVSRYYLHTGVVESSFDHDPAIEAAVGVLTDEARYRKVLAR